jgi:ubiquinone/menaquinone biosynthesis C-methylase UbiE
MDKGQGWKGYYDYYLTEARRQRVSPLAMLDEQWYDGRITAEAVLPYLSPASDVLEIACGIGRVSRFVAPHCRQLHCADILDEALEAAKTQLAGFNNISFDKINGYDLTGYQSESFDCVYSFTAFFHFDFELVVSYFAEIKRVLKPRGIAIIEFKQWKDKRDVRQLLDKIEDQGGLEIYHAELDKWRYVSKEMLAILCDFYDLEVVNPDVTKFTFRKR